MAPHALTAHANGNVGQPLPLLNIELIDGTRITGRQLQGKIVVYLFWATWCPICVGEMESYQALRNAYKDKGLEVLALSLDQEAGDVKAFVSRNPYDLPMAMRSDAVREAFGDIRGTPTVFVVDRTGILRFKHLGGISPENLGRIVEQLLNCAS
ncbi:TlpA disulfide reductase family protein [Accumulibacter sp.]|uniref:TlpA family protein disulfide reductase n=1 Tax=Accumulibacter sp. TaxID=2053492 RepID=UPI0028C3BEBA|nr:TlpA disulfide reductase family protein [Accumulibacter sp.]